MEKKRARLGVNLDHVCTLRQQRGEAYPDLGEAIRLAYAGGAEQLTLHLREDRRHVQDYDLELAKKVCRELHLPLNMEMGSDPDVLQKILAITPEWICLVPEKREEKTTEGGLDLINTSSYERILSAITQIRKHSPATKVSLFLDPDQKTLEKAVSLNVEAVELHTGDYSHAFLRSDQERMMHIEKIRASSEFLLKSHIHPHAGHGLTYRNIGDLLQLGLIEEYNIGHWIVAQAVFTGLRDVVQNLKAHIQNFELNH
jgi:pyridoxine 5-phosphate synthase